MRMQRALVEAAVMQAASRSRALHAAAEMRPARTRMMTSRLGRCSESRMLFVVADRGEPRLRLLRVVYVYCMLCTHSSGYLTRCRAECAFPGRSEDDRCGLSRFGLSCTCLFLV